MEMAEQSPAGSPGAGGTEMFTTDITVPDNHEVHHTHLRADLSPHSLCTPLEVTQGTYARPGDLPDKIQEGIS